MKIQVLLSTFNGGKYLSAQLDSILSQTGAAEVRVLVRDDGSSDNTRDVLQKYSGNPAFQIVFGENIGIERSYLWLLTHRDHSCDLFAMCDQDDVWYPNKLAEATLALKNADFGRPLLFASQSDVVDTELGHIRDTSYPEKGISFFHAMVQNCCPGHTQLINSALAELILRTSDTSSIFVMDWWIYLIASGLGTVVFLPKPLVYHRQHGANSVGYEDSWQGRWIRRYRRFFGGHCGQVAKQLVSFRAQFGSLLPKHYLGELNDFLDSRQNMIRRLGYLRRCRVYRNNNMETRRLKLLYAIGKFNEGSA